MMCADGAPWCMPGGLRKRQPFTFPFPERAEGGGGGGLPLQILYTLTCDNGAVRVKEECLQDGARGAHGSLLRRFARELRQLDAGHADSMGAHARARDTAAEHVGGQFEFAAEHFSSRGLRQFSFEDTAPMAAPGVRFGDTAPIAAPGVRFGETAPMAAPAGEQNIPEEFTLVRAAAMHVLVPTRLPPRGCGDGQLHHRALKGAQTALASKQDVQHAPDCARI